MLIHSTWGKQLEGVWGRAPSLTKMSPGKTLLWLVFREAKAQDHTHQEGPGWWTPD